MNSDSQEPLEALPMPESAVELDEIRGIQTSRQMVIAALKQVLKDRRLALPLGPESALDDENRLVMLNRFAVQLAPAGLAADQINVDLEPWKQANTAPQLLLAALVDDENDVVAFPGVLTGKELVDMAKGTNLAAKTLVMETEDFKGGIDRLLMFVQLLEQEALPRLSLVPVTASAVGAIAAVGDWLLGQLDESISALGGELRPVAAGAFRGAVGTSEEANALAKLLIPLGLQGDQLVSGDAATRCVRRLQLTLIPTGDEQVSGLVVLLTNAVAGALLPDGLRLEAVQGGHDQSVTSAMSSQLKLVLNAGDEVVYISLRFGEGKQIRLPALQLPK